MDLSSILAALGGGSGLSQGAGNGAIMAPANPNILTPHLQMPQFAGAGTNGGVQNVAAAAGRALSAPSPQQQSPMGDMGGMSPMMMAMMAGNGGMGSSDSGLLGLMGLNKPPTANTTFTGAGGSQLPMTISAPLPDLGGQGGGIHGLFHRIFG